MNLSDKVYLLWEEHCLAVHGTRTNVALDCKVCDIIVDAAIALGQEAA